MGVFSPNINHLKEKRDEEGLKNALNYKRKSSIRVQAAKALGELGGHLKRYKIPGTTSRRIGVAWSLIKVAIDDEDEKVCDAAWDALIRIKATRDLIDNYNKFTRFQKEPIRSKFLYAFAKIGDWNGAEMVVQAYLFGKTDVELLKILGEKAVDCIKSSLWSDCINNPVDFEYFDRCFSTLSYLGGTKARHILEEYEAQQLARARNEEKEAAKEEKIIKSEIQSGARNAEGLLHLKTHLDGDPETFNEYIGPNKVKERRDKAARHKKVADNARKFLASWAP